MKKRIIRSTLFCASMMLCFSLTSCDSDDVFSIVFEETTTSSNNTGTSSVKETTATSVKETTTTSVKETTTTGGTTTTTTTSGNEYYMHYIDNTLNLNSDLLTKNFGGDSSDKTITFYHSMGSSLQHVLKDAINKFKAKYPDWNVEDTLVGGYNDIRSRCIADLATGNQPDLAYCYTDHVSQYLKTCKVVDMSDYVNATGTINGNPIGYTKEEVADFIEGFYIEGFALNYADYNKHGYNPSDILTFPFVKSTEVLYYNKDALVQAGIVDSNGYAKAPETWDELWDDCEKLKKTFPNCTPLGYDNESNWVITMCEQNGWGYTQTKSPNLIFNTPELANWLDDMKIKFDKHYFTTQDIYQEYTSSLFTKGPEYGGSVFSICTSNDAAHMTTDLFDWGVAKIPGSKVGNKIVNSVLYQGPSLVMFQSDKKHSTERQLMTWEFVKCLEDAQFQASFAMVSGYIPTRLSSFENSFYEELMLDETSIVAATAKVTSKISNDFFTCPVFSGSIAAKDQMEAALLYVLRGYKTGEKALNDAYKACGGK